jgi:hypothetical protein
MHTLTAPQVFHDYAAPMAQGEYHTFFCFSSNKLN